MPAETKCEVEVHAAVNARVVVMVRAVVIVAVGGIFAENAQKG